VFIWTLIALFKKFAFFNKKGGSILIYGFLLMIFFIWILTSISEKIVVYNQPKNNIPVGEIHGDQKIGQTFVAEYNNLSAIELLLATFERKNTGEFIFHLRTDVRSEKDLFRYKGDMSKVKDNRYFRFRFPGIKDSKANKFYFFLEAPRSQPGNTITVWSNSEDCYEAGKKIVDGSPSDGDLVFKTAYDPGLKNNLNIFLEEITQNKPFPLNRKSFYIILIVFFALSCTLFITFLAKFFIRS
jgi:hypothetical protein